MVVYMAVVWMSLYIMLCSLQFIFIKGYQKKCGVSWTSAVWFSAVMYGMMAVILFCANGFEVRFTAGSFLLAVLFGCTAVIANFASIKAVGFGKVSTVSMFVLIGSAILPFLFGILIINEQMTVFKLCSVILMCAAFLPNILKEKGSRAGKGFIWLCILNAAVNGLATVIMKMGQMAGLSGMQFMMQAGIAGSLLSFLLLGFLLLGSKQKAERFEPVSLGYALLYALSNGFGMVASIQAAGLVDTSVEFPVASGGILVLTSLLSFFIYREKLKKYDYISIVTAIAAMVLFVF